MVSSGIKCTAALILISCIILSGCISDDTPKPTLTAEQIDAKIIDVVSNLDESDLSSFASADELVTMGEQAAPALAERLDDEDAYSRWAAAYALSNIAPVSSQSTQVEITPALKAAFADEDEFVSVTAAATAVSVGEKTGFPILIKALRNDNSLEFIEPRKSVSAYAFEVLSYYAGQDFGYDTQTPLSERETSVKKWESWWAANQDQLVWNPDKGEYGGYDVA